MTWRRTATTTALVACLGLLSGTGTWAQDGSAVAVHAPMPVPELPVPDAEKVVLPSGSLAPLAPVPEGESPLAPAVTIGFPALDDSNGAIPPDTHGAVGPNHLMVTLNTQVRVQDRLGAVLTTPLSLNGFWNPADSVSPLSGAFDPRTLYDPYGGRFISVACDDADSANSAIFIGVSANTSPIPYNTWLQFRIDVDGTDAVWADYPSVGFNQHWVVVQINMYDVGTGTFNRSDIYVFDKAALYLGVLSYNVISSGSIGGTQVPALTYDNTIDDIYLLQMFNSNFSGTGYLSLYTITGWPGAPSLVSGPLVAAPPWTHQTAGRADFAPQLDGPPGCQSVPGRLVQVNDSRIQSLVYRNGNLWAAHTVLLPTGTPTRSSIQWWQIDTLGNELQRGLVDDPGATRFYAFPSLAVNANDDVLLGYSTFQDNEYAGASYSFRTAIDPLNTMQPESVLKPGESCYYKIFTGTRNRWGDYSATVMDPTDDLRMWTLQEYAATSVGNGVFDDRWGTWWGMVNPTPEVHIDDVMMNEGDVGTTTFSFRVSLTDAGGNALASSQPITVSYRTGDGTGTVADLDYVGIPSGVLNIPPGSTEGYIDVTVNGDYKLEPDETFVVDLTGSTNSTIADNQATGTILNDDPVPQVSIGDVTGLEGSGGAGSPTDFVFPVTLSNPSSTAVSVAWDTVDGTATAGAFGSGDYVGGSAVVNIAPGTLGDTVTVQVHADTIPEPDRVFYVDLSAPVGATLLKTRGVGSIQDDDATTPNVLGFSVVADSAGSAPTDGRTHLQWLYPSGPAATNFRIRWDATSGNCAPPNPGDPSVSSLGLLDQPAGAPGTQGSWDFPGLNLGWEYCYTIWLDYGGGTYSLPGITAKGRMFDATGPVKWKLFTPMTAIAPPTVGLDAVIGVSNDMFVQAMRRDVGGGPWPLLWKTLNLGSIAQHRAPIVPIGGTSLAFITTQDGRVHAVRTSDGALLWSTLLPEGSAQGAPSVIVSAFGGIGDYVFVGTNSGAGDRFYALDSMTGAVIDAFPGPADGLVGTIGSITGTSAVDYGASRVVFASRMGTAPETVWALNIGPPADALSLAWRSSAPGEISGSPVLANGRVYVVDVASNIWSIRASDGLNPYSLPLSDGDGRGFVFPDRGSTDLFVATQTQVHGVVDNVGTNLVPKWPAYALPAPGRPSTVLLRPGTSELYVGVDNHPATGNAAGLLRLDASTGTLASSIQLETVPLVVGAPSLDNVFDTILVGSEPGTFYLILLPF